LLYEFVHRNNVIASEVKQSSIKLLYHDLYVIAGLTRNLIISHSFLLSHSI